MRSWRNGCFSNDHSGSEMCTLQVYHVPRLALAASTLMGAAMATACAGEETSCLTDVDCDQGQVCRASTCTLSCVVDSDCASDEVCVSRGQDESKACRADTLSTDDAGESETNTWIIQLRLAKPSDCSEQQSLPAIADIHVLGTGDEIVARAEPFLSNDPDAELTLPASEEPEDICELTPLELDCDTWVAARLVDESGLPIALSPFTQAIKVVEWREVCGGQTSLEYELLACTAPSEVENNDDVTSCTEVIGRGVGSVELEVN